MKKTVLIIAGVVVALAVLLLLLNPKLRCGVTGGTWRESYITFEGTGREPSRCDY
jgi:hypothetical protein